MAHLTLSGDWGVAEFFVISFHRLRTFPGRAGRLRPQLIIDNDLATYESAAGDWHVDFAARYSHTFGPLDIGLSIFDGTSREPVMRPTSFLLDNNGIPVLINGKPVPNGPLAPHYEQIRQFGLDAQLTIESWLLKLEAIHRSGASNLPDKKEDYAAFVVGGEYTFSGVFESEADLSLLAEWLIDGRRRRSTNQYQNDLFLGARLSLNDVQGAAFTLGTLTDLDFGTRTLSLEFDRRLTDSVSGQGRGDPHASRRQEGRHRLPDPPRQLRGGETGLQFLIGQFLIGREAGPHYATSFASSPFWIFRVGVIGISSIISSRSGQRIFATPFASRYPVISSKVRPAPGARVTNRHMRSPSTSSGIGTTAASTIAGWACRRFLDIGRIDLDAAAVDHVLDPAGDDDIAIGIDSRQVAGPEEAIGGEGPGIGFRIVQISREDAVARKLQLTLGAARNFDVVIGIGDPHLDAVCLAAGAGVADLRRRVERRLHDENGLGHAEQLPRPAVRQPAFQFCGDFGRADRSGDDDFRIEPRSAPSSSPALIVAATWAGAENTTVGRPLTSRSA